MSLSPPGLVEIIAESIAKIPWTVLAVKMLAAVSSGSVLTTAVTLTEVWRAAPTKKQSFSAVQLFTAEPENCVKTVR